METNFLCFNQDFVCVCVCVFKMPIKAVRRKHTADIPTYRLTNPKWQWIVQQFQKAAVSTLLDSWERSWMRSE